MRRIILAALVGILLSCSQKTQEEIKTDRQRQFREHVTIVEHNGHSYLFFKQGYGRSRYGGVTHNPDCECKNE